MISTSILFLIVVVVHRWQSRGCGFHRRVCLSVFRTISQKPLQLGSPNMTAMFHHECWKTIYFGVKRSKVKVTSRKKTVPAWALAFLWVMASYSYYCVNHLLSWKIAVTIVFETFLGEQQTKSVFIYLVFIIYKWCGWYLYWPVRICFIICRWFEVIYLLPTGCFT